VDNAQRGLSQAQASGDTHVAEAQAALQQIEQTGPLEAASKRRDAAALHETTREKKADVQAARVVASSTVVRASLSGVVTRRLLNPGDVADAGAPVVEVTDTHAVNLLANLPAEDGVKIRVGMRAQVTIADLPRHTFHGQVLSVGQVDPQTNLMSIRIAVPDPGSNAKLGTFATASVIIGSNAGAIVVPKSAVVTREGKPAVFIVGSDNVAHQRVVEMAGEHGDLVEVAHGVTPGEQVILLGQYELADGAPVEPSLARKSGQP
jgi:RND family efflux transporter MFP subunit